ncbi:putative protein YeaC [Chlamydiales bacterium STE3]|nr:putative protein YeaC [Chlamydiales bacterium STE3]
MTVDTDALTVEVQKANLDFKKVQEEMSKVIVGQKELIQSLLIALLADGHLLLEGLPGLAKTLAVTTLSKITQCQFKRIQFTPDLLPADLIGTSIYNPKDASFAISQGPIFTNILLADEINRAPAKVQSALLEVMQERQVTISGQTFKIDEPYLVLATQNPIEHEGTYPLPEAQMDRFMMKIKIDYPSKEEEREIIAKMATLEKKPTVNSILTTKQILEARQVVNSIYIDPKIIDYILDIVFATRYPEKYGLAMKELIFYGASPRASIALVIAAKAHAFLSNRGYVTPHDVKKVAYSVLRHRIKRTYEAEAEDVSAEKMLDRIFNQLVVP